MLIFFIVKTFYTIDKLLCWLCFAINEDLQLKTTEHKIRTALWRKLVHCITVQIEPREGSAKALSQAPIISASLTAVFFVSSVLTVGLGVTNPRRVDTDAIAARELIRVTDYTTVVTITLSHTPHRDIC